MFIVRVGSKDAVFRLYRSFDLAEVVKPKPVVFYRIAGSVVAVVLLLVGLTLYPKFFMFSDYIPDKPASVTATPFDEACKYQYNNECYPTLEAMEIAIGLRSAPAPSPDEESPALELDKEKANPKDDNSYVVDAQDIVCVFGGCRDYFLYPRRLPSLVDGAVFSGWFCSGSDCMYYYQKPFSPPFSKVEGEGGVTE